MEVEFHAFLLAKDDRSHSVDYPTRKPSPVIGWQLRPIASAVSRSVTPPTWMTKKDADATPLHSEGQDMTAASATGKTQSKHASNLATSHLTQKLANTKPSAMNCTA
jgi:hypothetical protein